MLSRLFRRRALDEATASRLYGAIVAAARSPGLYAGIGVPDSIEGRFESLVLHMVLLMRRLEPGGEQARATGQRVFDLFCGQMDNALRELGVGDLSVPKKMRVVGEAYFGRAAAYGPSLESGDAEALAEVLIRTVFDGENESGPATSLATYAITSATRLAEQGEDEIVAGRPDFPHAADFSSGEIVS